METRFFPRRGGRGEERANGERERGEWYSKHGEKAVLKNVLGLGEQAAGLYICMKSVKSCAAMDGDEGVSKS